MTLAEEIDAKEISIEEKYELAKEITNVEWKNGDGYDCFGFRDDSYIALKRD